MKHKFIPAAIMALSLLVGTVANAAGNELPISHGNRYTVNRDGGGEITYTVPFTANYEVTLSGSEGAGYPSGAGGYGYTLTTTVRLSKGQTITVSTPNRPAHYTEGTTTIVPHGNDSVLKINGKEFLRAGGGAPMFNQIIAPTGTLNAQVEGVDPLPVHWHSGNGTSGATHENQFPTVYSETLVGGCYGWSGHTHDATSTCARFHNHNLDKKQVVFCCMNINVNGNYIHKPGCPCDGKGCWTRASDPYFRDGWGRVCNGALNDYSCGYPNNTQVIRCGYSQGQILNVNNASYRPHICSGEFTRQSLSNTGNGKFTIRLAEQQELNYSNVVVTTPHYKGGLCELILKDDTVVYYKRK